ncbi:hypothetical protein FR257_11955 [Salmonella enterica subsp. enterica]|nr:hypothetical protein [Salmonella enterica subsp. enterica serovar Agbeni]ECL0916771.1 hypothetical protein [Salmonella enterica subsp. enterica serovar Agbeni]
MANTIINALINILMFISGVLVIWGFEKIFKKETRFMAVFNRYLEIGFMYFKVMICGALVVAALLFIFN